MDVSNYVSNRIIRTDQNVAFVRQFASIRYRLLQSEFEIHPNALFLDYPFLATGYRQEEG